MEVNWSCRVATPIFCCKEGDFLLGLFIVRVGKAELHGEDVVDGGAEVARAELLIPLEQETGTEQERDGERDLRGEKRFAQGGSAAATAVRAGGALQRFEELADMQAE